jgi:hypothetical protein
MMMMMMAGEHVLAALATLLLASLLTLVLNHFLPLLLNPKAPRGSFGWPLLGETLRFLTPHASNTLGGFLEDHCSRYTVILVPFAARAGRPGGPFFPPFFFTFFHRPCPCSMHTDGS